MPDELRHTAELLRALEFTREKVDNVISEARRRGCLFYRFDRDRSNGIISLRLKNLDGVSFRRMLNCNSFFKSSGGYSESEASRILAEVDALFTASGDFKVYPPVVRNHRRGRRPRRDKV